MKILKYTGILFSILAFLMSCNMEKPVENVVTMGKRDYMPTYFIAETLKYLYLIFSHEEGNFKFDDYVFNTEAHPYKKINTNN